MEEQDDASAWSRRTDPVAPSQTQPKLNNKPAPPTSSAASRLFKCCKDHSDFSADPYALATVAQAKKAKTIAWLCVWLVGGPIAAVYACFQLVWFLFPKPDEERSLLQAYLAEDEASAAAG